MKLLIIARSDYVQKYSHLSNRYSYTVMYVYGTKQSINRIKIDNKKEGYNIDVKHIDEFKGECMKFDYIVGNPPYQSQVGEHGKTRTIWDEIVIKCYSLLKYKGIMSLIHPGGWRFSNDWSNNNLFKVKEIYQNNKIIKMELNDKIKGKETFGAITDYDIVTLKKEPNYDLTTVTTKTDGNTEINLKTYDKIPTDNFKMFNKLKAKNNEPKVEIIFDSNYHTSNGGEKCRVRDIKDKIFKYPIIYCMSEGGVKFYYSNTNQKGHFGISKLILAKAGYHILLDLKGEYGMTQFAAGIVDIPENLIKIQKVISLSKFKRLKNDFCGIGNDAINGYIDAHGTMFKFLKEFRKDFWKEFYTPEIEQELIKEGKLDKEGKYIR